jgi:NADH-quinone oxidoreductase subunit C
VTGEYGCSETTEFDQRVLYPSAEDYLALVERLFSEGYGMCIDLTAVDYQAFMARELPDGVDPERYEVVVSLMNLRERERVRLRVQIPDDEPSIASLHAVYFGSDALEREVYDMFGINFDGHPFLTRILMPEDWDGHPLRKDFSHGRIPVQFKAADNVR